MLPPLKPPSAVPPRAKARGLPAKDNEIAKLAIDRWMTPRAERRPEFLYWKSENLEKLLHPEHNTVSVSLKPPLSGGIKRSLKDVQNFLSEEEMSLLIQNVNRLNDSANHLRNLEM